MTLIQLLNAIAFDIRDPAAFEAWFEALPEEIRQGLCDLAQHAADAGMRVEVLSVDQP